MRKNKDIPYYNFLSPLINETKQIIDEAYSDERKKRVLWHLNEEQENLEEYLRINKKNDKASRERAKGLLESAQDVVREELKVFIQWNSEDFERFYK